MMAPTPGEFSPEKVPAATPRFVLSTPSQSSDSVTAAVGSTPMIPSDVVNGMATEGSSKSQCSSMSDGESYECYGEGVDLELDPNGSPGHDVASGESVGSRSPPHGPLINRHTWLRTSLRRSPNNHQDSLPNRRWGSFRHPGKRQLGSNALASSSFNSSGRSSTCDTADDMYSDVSLEEDVLDLNHKVQLLQQQVNVLADSANNTDDRYTRAKADNAALQARVHMLEEQIREVELRADERFEDEQRRHRELITRIEREKQLQLENCSIRLQTLELEVASVREEAGRQKALVERLRQEKENIEDRSFEVERELKDAREELKEMREGEKRQRKERETTAQLIDELSKEIERLRVESRTPALPTTSPETLRLEELHNELESLRDDNRSLKESNEELQAALLTRSVEAGRSLLVGTEESLAAEFEAMSHDQSSGEQHSTVAKMQKALKEQQDVNTQLRSYIDGILLNIVENYPQLLEVKHRSS